MRPVGLGSSLVLAVKLTAIPLPQSKTAVATGRPLEYGVKLMIRLILTLVKCTSEAGFGMPASIFIVPPVKKPARKNVTRSGDTEITCRRLNASIVLLERPTWRTWRRTRLSCVRGLGLLSGTGRNIRVKQPFRLGGRPLLNGPRPIGIT